MGDWLKPVSACHPRTAVATMSVPILRFVRM
jgi:hypothetical protein